MKNLFVSFALILSLLTSASCNRIQYEAPAFGYRFSMSTGNAKQKEVFHASDNYMTKEIKIKDFNKVKATGWLNISYTQSDKACMEIYAPDNIMDCFVIDSKNGDLNIRYKENITVYCNKTIDIKIASPNMERVELLGAAKFNINNTLTAQNFSIETSGSSCVYCTEINCNDKFSTELKGSGEYIIKKVACKNATIKTKGSGTQKLDDLTTAESSISIAGSGDIDIQSLNTDSLDAQISGSGNITLGGKAMKAQYKIAGSGNIKARDMKSQTASCKITGSGNINCHAEKSLDIDVRGSGRVKYQGKPLVKERY